MRITVGAAADLPPSVTLNQPPTGASFGITTGLSAGSSIHRNQLLSFPDNNGTAIVSGIDNQCGNNNHTGWDSGIVGCADAGGNFGN